MKKKLKKLNWSLFKVKVSKIRWILSCVRLIKVCLIGIDNIGYPTNEKEKNQLTDYIKAYDITINHLERELVSKFRTYTGNER